MVGILNNKIHFLSDGFIRHFLNFVSVNNMLDKPFICNENISEIGGRKAQINPNS